MTSDDSRNQDELRPLQGQELAASLTASDVTASMAWYRDVLGFEVARRFEREGALQAASMKAGDVRILLTQDDGERGWDRVKGEGFSLQITTLQDIDQVADRVRGQGVGFETEPTDTPWGVRMFRVRDPDGFRLTVASG